MLILNNKISRLLCMKIFKCFVSTDEIKGNGTVKIYQVLGVQEK